MSDSKFELPPAQFVVSNEQVNQWLERGLEKEQTVVSIGTSIEELQIIRATGNIVPSRADFPYQNELLEIHNAKFLYFASPLYETFTHHKPELGSELMQQLQAEHKDEPDISSYLSVETMREENLLYARINAVQDYFLSQTGIFMHHADIISLGYHNFGKDVLNNGELLYLERDEEESKNMYAQYQQQFGAERFKKILRESLTRQGIILYLNSTVFNHHIELGVESSEEVIIVTQKQLSHTDIHGIEILSPQERQIAGF